MSVTPDELAQALQTLGRAMFERITAKRPASQGRQRDPGAALEYHDVLMVPLAIDRGKPGRVYAPDLGAAGALDRDDVGTSKWHSETSLVNGVLGGRAEHGIKLGNLLQVVALLGVGGPASAAITRGISMESPLGPPPPLPAEDDDLAKAMAVLKLLKGLR